MYMIASFNGLVCCINGISDEGIDDFHGDLQIWICNPSTEETLLLPQTRPLFGTEPCIGVGYRTDMSEYKVYSSSTGAWRNIGPMPHRPEAVCFSPYKSSHVFAGGKIYWLVSLDGPGKEVLFVTKETGLWSFDLGTNIWDKKTSPLTEYVNSVIFPFTESLVPCNVGLRLEKK
ncbi:unnamed protein product [Thlaspi arvense]|uniref:F-box protein n=1 Tax=Thlaspi arvense TaxID=13288 RepID=A0AAU9RYM8_THLAR|nr:unnamed protein product [Thlaspi arvense]